MAKTMSPRALLRVLTVLSLGFTAQPSFAADKPPVSDNGPFAPIDTLVSESIARQRLPGAVILIVHESKIVFHKAYGSRFRSDGSPEYPAQKDTIYDLA